MTTLEAVKGISNYPIPQRTLNEIAVARGLDLTKEATQEILLSSEYQLAKADLYNWLSETPNVSEGGVNFSFTPEDKAGFKLKSTAITSQVGTPVRSHFGYKGENL